MVARPEKPRPFAVSQAKLLALRELSRSCHTFVIQTKSLQTNDKPSHTHRCPSARLPCSVSASAGTLTCARSWCMAHAQRCFASRESEHRSEPGWRRWRAASQLFRSSDGAQVRHPPRSNSRRSRDMLPDVIYRRPLQELWRPPDRSSPQARRIRLARP